MPMLENERIVRQFIRILKEESKKSESSIFPEGAWQKLDDLKGSLAGTNDDIEAIESEIVSWCKKNQYKTVLEALISFRRDPIEDGEEFPEPDNTDSSIKTVSLRSAIEDAQERRQKKKE
ncbi:MAG: hypothetical protein F6J93_04660 [Oscillatoria sp. SIO1A7]|nr:hypothetical protein [Oscillatoria sp. SIO1A7]